ncbi:hypothetical protein [Chroococcus sp. FPU101]|uniref:hypothetical protein n=1 Tax=Chroococcus sp. FPU101 TaxID=1974212 RepID=UPI001A8C9295|nr:hypothetical protein [Chroococcus sp. FPU101]GFE70074.1 hypothetical protein CFPU101_26840 [Chroococcus sp. FPU101]
MKLTSFFGKRFSQLTFVTAIALNLYNTNAVALSNLSSTRETSLIAQKSVCPPSSGGSEFVTAETANFYIYICGGDLPNTYFGVAKNSKTGGIILPLQSYSKDQFVAVNGNVRYTLTRHQLIVTRQGKVILKEKATWLF